LQQSLSQVDARIAELQSRLSGRASTNTAAPAAGGGNRGRTMSPAARRRIALAQKKRWAKYKAEHSGAAKPKAQKRKLSAAGRARIVAATRKRWAAYRKAQQAPAKAPARKAVKKAVAKKEPAAPPPQTAATAGAAAAE
jgi:hypothetical protein